MPVQFLNEVAVAVTALGGLIIATLVQLNGIRQQQQKVLGQVKNSHPTNLRDDIDHATSLMSEIKTDIRELRHEVRDERLARERASAEAHNTHQEIFGRLRHLEEAR